MALGTSRSGRPRVGLYLSVSKGNGRRGDRYETTRRGVRRWEAEARAAAARHGWRVARIYTDGSSSFLRRRRGYQAMRDDLEAGVLDLAISWSEDNGLHSPVVSADSVGFSARLADVGLLRVDDERSSSDSFHPTVAVQPPAFMLASGGPRELLHIDRGIVPLVRALWDAGIPTDLSCQGGDRLHNGFRRPLVQPAHVGVPESDLPELIRIGRDAGLDVTRNRCGVSLPASDVVAFAYAINGYMQPRLW